MSLASPMHFSCVKAHVVIKIADVVPLQQEGENQLSLRPYYKSL